MGLIPVLVFVITSSLALCEELPFDEEVDLVKDADEQYFLEKRTPEPFDIPFTIVRNQTSRNKLVGRNYNLYTNCKWSYCAGILVDHTVTCGHVGKGKIPIGARAKGLYGDVCKFDSIHVLCCDPVDWTKTEGCIDTKRCELYDKNNPSATRDITAECKGLFGEKGFKAIDNRSKCQWRQEQVQHCCKYD